MPAAPTPPTQLLGGPSVELTPGKPAILFAESTGDPAGWVGANRDGIRGLVTTHGALLVRGLGLHDAAGTGATFRALTHTLMTEREAFAARESHGGGVHSVTKWPANQPMCMHHELSYTLELPGLMMFACLSAPAEGGATAVADAAEMYRALPADLVARFEREGWLLTRSYNDEIGASWAEAFSTEDEAEVEAYCKANAIEFAWDGEGGLRTRQRRSAVLRHPVTGARCWVNQIAFLNEWTLAEEVREYLVDEYGADGLPFNTRFGNGDEVGADVVALINETYDAHTRREPWRSGDLLLVDNIASAHSRDAFSGPREVLAGLADPVQLAQCSPTIEIGA
jgi:alpha-ketoglutarate-dependent taurine dioxygenase